jgi:ABC-type branched-subunit amino acid transport system ATPase component
VSAALLETRGLGRDFGGLRAVHDLAFAVEAGQIKALIGPNGAGKSTTLGMIAGAVVPSRGAVRFEGRDLPAGRPHAVAARGIARTFQLARLFGDMTVLETVLVGCDRAGTRGWLACALRTRAMRREEARLRARAHEILALVGLAERAAAPAAALPYGEQRLLEVARALATSPRLVLLDEPGAGLGPAECARLAAVVRAVRARGTTVLLVDHHVAFVMDLADEVLVLCQGEKLAEGAPARVRRDPAVIAAYVGDDDDEAALAC